MDVAAEEDTDIVNEEILDVKKGAIGPVGVDEWLQSVFEHGFFFSFSFGSVVDL